MSNERLKSASHFLISVGVFFQVAFFLIDSLSPYRFWGVLQILADCVLGLGYYANFRSKEYAPFRSGWFYVLTGISFLPVIGPIAAILKLSLTPRRGEKMEVRNKERSLAFGKAALFLAALFHVAWPQFTVREKLAKYSNSVLSAQEEVKTAYSLKETGKDASVTVTEAEKYLDTARAYSKKFDLHSMDHRIDMCSGDQHYLRGEWDLARQDYEKALASGDLMDDVQKRLVKLRASEKRETSR